MKFCVHFIGIGGVSMSALAKYLLSLGFCVSGSDLRSSRLTRELEDAGAKILFDHSTSAVENAQTVVYSDAIKSDDPELMKAKELGLYVVGRNELLKSVAENFRVVTGVGGCHGKTTVTCMLAHIYDRARKAFTAHIGGEDREFSNFVARGSDSFLTEVCEYKKNLLGITCNTAVCLNTDPDHLDCYTSKEELLECYFKYLKTSDKAIICADDDGLKKYDGLNAVKFGLNFGEYRAVGLTARKGVYAFDFCKNGRKLCRVRLSVVGRHNAINALAAATAAIENGVGVKAIKSGLKDFTGVKRRFEKIGKLNGCKVVVDYAHHPSEIEAAISTARELYGKNVVTVFQPHTYSRTLFLKDEFVKTFSKIDDLILYKTFPAREAFTAGGSAADLRNYLGGKSEYYEDFNLLIRRLRELAGKKVVFLILGAGDLAELFRDCLSR